MKATTAKDLHKKIDAFLSKRRRSRGGGGWAEVEDKDIEDLREIAETLISLKCETDADGDYPIEIEITNRRTHMRSHFQPVPYDKIDHDQYFGRTELNFDIALDAYRIARRLDDYRKRDPCHEKK